MVMFRYIQFKWILSLMYGNLFLVLVNLIGTSGNGESPPAAVVTHVCGGRWSLVFNFSSITHHDPLMSRSFIKAPAAA